MLENAKKKLNANEPGEAAASEGEGLEEIQAEEGEEEAAEIDEAEIFGES